MLRKEICNHWHGAFYHRLIWMLIRSLIKIRGIQIIKKEERKKKKENKQHKKVDFTVKVFESIYGSEEGTVRVGTDSSKFTIE